MSDQRHEPRAVTLRHAHAEHHKSKVNEAIAIVLNAKIGNMLCAYAFCLIAAIGLLAILGILPAIVALLVAWASQSFIQLVMLPVIMVSQNVLGKQQEMQSAETARQVSQILADMEELQAALGRIEQAQAKGRR